MKTADRIAEAAEMRRNGYTYADIAGLMNISRQRVYQMVKAAAMQQASEGFWGYRFSLRTINCLQKMMIETKEDALRLYNSGHLKPNAVRGFGVVSYNEVCHWLGVPPSINRRPICQHCGKQL